MARCNKAERPAEALGKSRPSFHHRRGELGRRLALPCDRHAAAVTQTPARATNLSVLALATGALFSGWRVSGMVCTFGASPPSGFAGWCGRRLPAPAESGRTGRPDVAARLGLRRLPTIGLVPARVPPMLWASFVGPAAADLARRALVSSRCSSNKTLCSRTSSPT